MNSTLRTAMLWMGGATLGVAACGVAGQGVASADTAKKAPPHAASSSDVPRRAPSHAASATPHAASATPSTPRHAASATPSVLPPESKVPVQPPKAGERKAPSNLKSDTKAQSSERGNDGAGGSDAEPQGKSSACPTGMVLVEGDYCSKVEHECEKSWYDESNKKTVCEKFAKKA